MKKEYFKIIFVGLLLALGSDQLIVLTQTLYYMLTGSSFNIILFINSLSLSGWVSYPIIVSGIYIGFSEVKGKILAGAVVGILYYLTGWLYLLLGPGFYYSFKALSFGFEIVRKGFECAIVAWLTYLALRKFRDWKSRKK
jgi:hypothetical protein